MLGTRTVMATTRARKRHAVATMIDLRAIADDVLEASVVGSFTKVGYEARRRMFGWQDLDRLHMDGKVVVITGGNSGLGLAAATELAGMGAAVRILVRNAERGEAARRKIAAAGIGDVRVYLADLSSLASVRAAAEAIRDGEPRIDVLIHNAGALLPERSTSADGHEATFATMVLGPFLLTKELLPRLRSAPGARVVWISSGGMYTRSRSTWIRSRCPPRTTGGPSPTPAPSEPR